MPGFGFSSGKSEHSRFSRLRVRRYVINTLIGFLRVTQGALAEVSTDGRPKAISATRGRYSPGITAATLVSSGRTKDDANVSSSAKVKQALPQAIGNPWGEFRHPRTECGENSASENTLNETLLNEPRAIIPPRSLRSCKILRKIASLRDVKIHLREARHVAATLAKLQPARRRLGGNTHVHDARHFSARSSPAPDILRLTFTRSDFLRRIFAGRATGASYPPLSWRRISSAERNTHTLLRWNLEGV